MAKLFGSISIPDRADKDEIYRLFRKLKDRSINDFEYEDLIKQLMALITERVMSVKWVRTLSKEKIDRQDAAQYVNTFLWRKLPSIDLRTDCALGLLSCLITAINNLLISRVRQQSKKSELHPHQQGEHFGSLTSDTSSDVSTALQGLNRHLSALSGPTLDSATKSLYEYLVNEVASGNGVPSFDRVPKHISSHVGQDVYAIAVYRVNRECSIYAESL